MSTAPEDPATLAALIPDIPLEPPLVPVDPEPGVEIEGAELFSTVGLRLSGTLFLQHVCLGSWFVTLSSYVAANSGESGSGIFGRGFIGVAYAAGPLGAMISPFLTGWLADRHFAAERLMAVLHLICAFALWGAIAAPTQGAFFLAMFVYFMCFHPSASLAASMTLHHLRRPERDFPIARAGGTAGWVVAGLLIGWLWPAITGRSIEGSSVPMQIGVVASLATGAFALILPHTPPANRRRRTTAAVSLTRPPSDRLFSDGRFVALMVLAFFAHIPTQFYYAYGNVFFNWSGMQSTAAKMTLGQCVEVAVMLLLPFVLRRLSIKTMILIGLSLWGLRFLMLSAASMPSTPGRTVLMYAAILLHGAAFTLVSISLQLDVDRCAGHHRRATAQGLFAVAYQGFGCFTGAQLAGLAAGRLMPVEVKLAAPDQWQTFWLLPAAGIFGVICLTAAALRRVR